MTNNRITIVNGTGTDLRSIGLTDEMLATALRNGGELPEEVADLLTMTVIQVDGYNRGIINFS